MLGCQQKDRKAGIWLSFDDNYINEWFELRELFIANNVKVTFFITRPGEFSEADFEKLKILEGDGHEIGFHGNMHVLSEYYIKEHSYKKYLDLEIDAGLDYLKGKGFECTSFAYPYGAKYHFTDLLLGRRFDRLRGVTPLNPEKDLTKMDDIYYKWDNDKTVSGISFDTNSQVTKKMIAKGMERAAAKKEVLMLYAHKPVKTDEKGYLFNVEMLQYIIEAAKENHLQFFTSREF